MSAIERHTEHRQSSNAATKLFRGVCVVGYIALTGAKSALAAAAGVPSILGPAHGGEKLADWNGETTYKIT